MNTGQIVKSRSQDRFTQIDNDFLRNPNLTAKAKGLMGCLLSWPVDWVLYKKKLPDYFADGYDSLMSGWEELEKHGYIVGVQVIDTESGKFMGWNYVVYAEPVLPEKSTNVTESGFSRLGKPATGESPPTNKEITKKEFIYPEFVEMVNSFTKKRYRGDKKSERAFRARLREGWTKDGFEAAIRAATASEYHKQNKYEYLTPEFFSRPDKLDKFSQNTTQGANQEDVYQSLKAKGWKGCTTEELEWAYDYQHRDSMSYIKYPSDERLGNRGSNKTTSEYDAEEFQLRISK